MILGSVAERAALLDRSQIIAMVGASNNPNRASYFVFRYLTTMTPLRVYAVNPMISDIDGAPVFKTLADLAQAVGPPDIVDVFRRPADLLAVTQAAIAVQAKAIWYQYGLIDDAAIALADAAGLAVVIDRCLKVEIARLNGGLAMGGIDSGLISSKRRSRP